MDHLFLLRTQAHELKMRLMVEDINLGSLTIDQAMAKFNVLTRHTVKEWDAFVVSYKIRHLSILAGA